MPSLMEFDNSSRLCLRSTNMPSGSPRQWSQTKHFSVVEELNLSRSPKPSAPIRIQVKTLGAAENQIFASTNSMDLFMAIVRCPRRRLKSNAFRLGPPPIKKHLYPRQAVSGKTS